MTARKPKDTETTMRVTADRKALADALGWVAQVVARKPVVPMLAGVHVTADEKSQTLTIRGTDYDTWLSADVPADVLDGGTAVVGAYRLRDLVAAMAGAQVTLEHLDALKVTSGRASYALPVIDADTWPAAPDSGPTLFAMDADYLRDAWGKVAFAVDAQCDRHDLRGVEITVTDQCVSLAGSNRYILAALQVTVPTESEGFTLAPVRAVTEALRGMDGLVTISGGGGLVCIGSADRESVIRTMPTDRRADIASLFGMPTAPVRVEVDVADLVDAIKRAELGAGSLDGGTRHVVLDGETGELRVCPVGGDVTGADAIDAVLDAVVSGRFNGTYLRDCLTALGAKRATMTLNKPGGKVLASEIVEAGLDQPRHLLRVMGVRA